MISLIFAILLFFTQDCEYNIYPNPCKDYFYIESECELPQIVEIYTFDGKLVQKEKIGEGEQEGVNYMWRIEIIKSSQGGPYSLGRVQLIHPKASQAMTMVAAQRMRLMARAWRQPRAGARGSVTMFLRCRTTGVSTGREFPAGGRTSFFPTRAPVGR